MSGPTASLAMRERFEPIRRTELERLSRKKLRGLTDDQLRSVAAITAAITAAIVGHAERGLSQASQPAVDAVAQLFAL